MKIRKFIITVCEWLHAPMVLAVLPACIYMLFKERSDTYISWMCTAAFLILLPANIILRTAVMHAKTLWLYLLAAVLVFTAVFFAAPPLVETGIEGMTAVALRIMLYIETTVLAADCFAIRMDDNRRRIAREENDPEFREEARLSQNPSIGGVLVLSAAYAGGVVLNCPAMCSIAFWMAGAYLIMFVVYRFLTSTEQYLQNRHDISHVPEARIRKISTAVLAVFLMLICFSITIAALTSGSRRYTDLRQEKEKRPAAEVEIEIPQTQEQEMPMQEDLMAMLAEDAPQPWIGWEYLAWIISGAAMLLVLVGIILAIRRIFEQFRTRPEENGDVAVSLEPEDEVQILESGRVIPKIFLTEDEKIRRRFRRMILKNRKDRPAPAETPLEMEKIAGIDQKQDVRLLHEEYERVRYGTGTR